MSVATEWKNISCVIIFGLKEEVALNEEVIFSIVNGLAKAFAGNSAALYNKMGCPGYDVDVPRVPILSAQRSPGSHFENIDRSFASSSSDYIIIRPVQSAVVILSPKICEFHFNLFVASENWNDTELTFLLKINKTRFFPSKRDCNCCLRRKNTCEASNQDVGPTMWKWEKSNHKKVLFSQV